MPGPQSAVGRNPTALFHLCARISLDGAGERRRVPRARIPLRTARVSPPSPVFVMPASRSPLARSRVHAVRAYPVGVRKKRPLHSAFADRAVGKIGRQFSYKQNAEEGVRLDEKRRTMDRGTRGGWRRSYGLGSATGMPALSRAALRPVCALRRGWPARLFLRSLRSHPHELPHFRSYAARARGRIHSGRSSCRRSLPAHRSSFPQSRISALASS